MQKTALVVFSILQKDLAYTFSCPAVATIITSTTWQAFFFH